MEKRLYRDEHRKKIAGVCAGLADYFNMDVSIVRALFLLALILKGGGVVIYIVLWIVLPVKHYFMQDPLNVDYSVPPADSFQPVDPFMATPVRHRSGGTIVAGTILILLGSFFLMDEFDVIPDWDFDRLWPVILIIVGIVIMVARGKKQPWEHDNWHTTGNNDKKEETTNDNPTTL